MEIKLIVIRTPDPKQLADFYILLGFVFDYHKHGNSPYHYSALAGKTVLEIYPLAKDQFEADKNIRLGFNLDNFDQVMDQLKKQNVPFSKEAGQTDYGFMAVISDPDGRKIELYKPE